VLAEAVLSLEERGRHPVDVDVRHADDAHGEPAGLDDRVRVVEPLVGLPVVEVVREHRGVEGVHERHEVPVLGGLVGVIPVSGDVDIRSDVLVDGIDHRSTVGVRGHGGAVEGVPAHQGTDIVGLAELVELRCEQGNPASAFDDSVLAPELDVRLRRRIVVVDLIACRQLSVKVAHVGEDQVGLTRLVAGGLATEGLPLADGRISHRVGTGEYALRRYKSCRWIYKLHTIAVTSPASRRSRSDDFPVLF
jgi:hypothetical protein